MIEAFHTGPDPSRASRFTLLRRCARVAAALAAMAATCLPACAPSSPTRAPAGPTDTAPLESRLDALPGRTLVVPMQLSPGERRAQIPVRLQDGRVLEGKLWRVTVGLDPSAPPSWLPPAGAWSAAPLDPRAQPTAAPSGERTLASWILTVDLPLSLSGKAVEIDGRDYKLNVLPPLTPPGTVARPGALIDPPSRAGSPPALTRLIEPEAASPVRRWRYRLWLTGLDEGVPVASFDTPPIEAMAQQLELRWSWALRSLARSDAALAQRLSRRLVSVTDFGGSDLIPTWPTSQGDLDALLSDLLDPALDHARRAERAEAFLAAQPEAAAWIIDDAGTPDAASGRPSAAVGIANLSERPVLAAAAREQNLSLAEPAPLAPGSVARIFVAPDRAASPSRETAIGVQAGSWRASLQAFTSNIPCQPPGLTLGPLSPDFTLDTWLAAASHGSPASDSAWATVGMLYRRGADWTLYVECAHPETSTAASEEDTVRVWLGPTARPALVIRVGESGYAHVEQTRAPDGQADDPSAGVVVSDRSERKWVCQIPVPAWVIDQGGILRLGIERTDARGARSAFPRPLLPWQTEPARLAIDTRAWGAVPLK